MPDHLFTTELHLSDQHLNEVLTAEASAKKTKKVWGWTRQAQPYTDHTLKLAKLVGARFIDIATGYLQCQQQGRRLRMPHSNDVYDMEFSSIYLSAIKPGHSVNVPVSRGALWRAVGWLQCDPESHRVSIQPKTGIRPGPPGLYPNRHTIQPEMQKVVFIPHGYNFDYAPGTSKNSTVLFLANIIFKKTQ